MPRKLTRQKRRIGFFISDDVDYLPAEPGAQVDGHYEVFTDDGDTAEERKHVHHPFRRAPVVRGCKA